VSRRSHSILLCIALTAFAPACVTASTDDAEGVLRSTARNMGEIRSGTLELSLSTALKDRKPSGFRVSGPFSFDSPGEFPVGRFEHTRFDGDRETTNTLISTGTSAFVRTTKGTFRLGPADTRALRGLGSRGSSGIASQLEIDDWMRGRPTVSAGGLVGGVDTNKVIAQLDPAAVMNGLIQIAEGLGSPAAGRLAQLEGAEAERVRRAVRRATMEVYSGKDDQVLRKLMMHVVFGVDREDLADVKELQGITIDLEASITELNEPVRVSAPDNAQPLR
jgi:hypothetical protein